MIRIKTTLIILLIMVIHGIVFADDAYRIWTDNYDALLQEYVKTDTLDGISLNIVDYSGIRENTDISGMLQQLAELVPVTTLSRDYQLAFWINAYNFLTIVKIVDNPGLTSIRKLNKLFKSVWQQSAGIISGSVMTLDGIEHGIIRNLFKEPSIHFAVNCASVSCPDLRSEAYRGDRLEEQLADQLRIFAQNSKKGIMVDDSTKTIYLSKIFIWYNRDFPGGPENWLIHYGYLATNVEKYTIKYFDYNWNINAQPGKN